MFHILHALSGFPDVAVTVPLSPTAFLNAWFQWPLLQESLPDLPLFSGDWSGIACHGPPYYISIAEFTTLH